MSVAPKRFSDDELEWKAKKIKNVRIEHAKINQINLARKKSKPLVSFKQIAQSNPAKAKLLKREKLSNNGYEVVFKITSSAKNTEQLSAHLNYISRQGSLELIDSDLNIYTDKKDLVYCLENYQNGYVIPNENENKTERRETYNMVFSMRDYDDCDESSLRNAAFETIKNLYPNTHFTLAFHNDTDNPHCHICLKATNNDGSRIDIKKADCLKIRKSFADNLNKRGIYALATSRRDKVRGRQIANNNLEYVEPKTLHEHNAKPHYYRVLDFGEAPYNNDILNKPSYFISYYTRKGNATIWGENLRQIVEDSKLQKGEYVRIAKIGYELRPYEFEKKIKGRLYTISTATKVAKWDISVMNRAEKSFIKLPKVKVVTTMKLKESNIKSTDSTNITKNAPKRYTKQEWANYYSKKANLTQRIENAKPKSRKYTREQWAKYNAERKLGGQGGIIKPNATLYKSNTPSLRNPPKSYADMCGMSKGNVAYKQGSRPSNDKVLLPSNAQHNLRSNTKQESKGRNDNRELRWTIGGDTGIARE
ncbi:hypothetical protein LS66_008790 [Helicobacter sp. MIT 03-1614]|uniref:IncQ plasmid conjugative transfer DNA nicking endonuclease TraR (PTi VirD2 homolog) n=3 Tax=Helicobacter TaxID=209 RepID=A0A099UHM9_9HELI|nr:MULTISPECIES: MobP1 family relaxase [Helicobacter]TLD79264.1 hypothetical protein LS75_002950 [Helicobacter typhlonius]TLD86921.1 hypothetical protein LS66_008790 [Helicobacter sp. MIT 03-1614]CUU40621.1 IncQ plasmid conjugative transfer DNA nicking endonuclease TraR (pTi VirD2 homolog) [Helicobacter typhlonius]